MKKAFGDYRLLANRYRRGGSLWLGPDHLLEIETAGFLLAFSETYRRIDLRNIQAVTYARTSSWIWLSVVLGLLALGGVTIDVLVARSRETDLWPLVLMISIVAAICFAALVVNLVKGPSCVCKVQTAVQIRNLRPVSRLRVAERLVQTILPLCIAHQGGESVTAEAIQSSAAAPQSHGYRPPVGAVPMPAVHLKTPWAGAKIVTIATVLLVVSGAVTIASLFFESATVFTLNWMLALAAYVASIAALVKAMRFEMPIALKSSLWGAMVAFVLSLVSAFGLFVWATMEVARTGHDADNPSMAAYLFLAHANLRDLGWVAWWMGGLGGMCVFFGLLGLSAAPWPITRAVDAPSPARPAMPPSPTTTAPQPGSPEFKP